MFQVFSLLSLALFLTNILARPSGPPNNDSTFTEHTDDPNSSESSHLSTGVLVGIGIAAIVGSIFLTIVIGFIGRYIQRKRNTRKMKGWNLVIRTRFVRFWFLLLIRIQAERIYCRGRIRK